MATHYINGSPVLNVAKDLRIKETVSLGMQKMVKPGVVGIPKNMGIVDVFRNPDAPSDRGEKHKLLIQTCTFERITVFDNQRNLGILMKLPIPTDPNTAKDSATARFMWTMQQIDARILACMKSDGITFPKDMGKPEDRYNPIIKRSTYDNREVLELRGMIPLDDNMRAKDCLVGEIRADGPVPLTIQEFLLAYKNRQAVAIVEFPYLSCMNSGLKSVTLKSIVKQILLLPPTPNRVGGCGDNSSFRFEMNEVDFPPLM